MMFIEINCNGGCAHLISVKSIAVVHDHQNDLESTGCIIETFSGDKWPVKQSYAQVTADILRVTATPTPMTRLN